MIERKDGGPAFPQVETEKSYSHEGMSLRDWFAGQALVGHLANNGATSDMILVGAIGIAESCFKIADAMLQEKRKHETI